MAKYEAIFTVDKEDVGGGVRAKGKRTDDAPFYGSIYIGRAVAMEHRTFRVIIEPVTAAEKEE